MAGLQCNSVLTGQCSQCGAQGPLTAFTVVGEKLCCQTCAGKLAKEARERGEKPQIASVIDPTVCYKCKRDNGSQELPTISRVPYCARCSEEFYQRPLPQWLRLSLAGLLVLLVGALVHGRPYFRAGRSLLHGEKLVEHGRLADGIPYLEAALKVAPECEEGLLLLGKAYFLVGRPEEGSKLLQVHNGGRFEKNDLSDEVAQISARVNQAFESLEQAGKLQKQNKSEEAANAMHKAAALYPQLTGLNEAVLLYDGAAAFVRKDFDGFLKIAQGAWEKHANSLEAAKMLASALACKYAVTGEPDYRSRSEHMLVIARGLAPSSADASAGEKEFEVRIRHRLQSRQIIGTDEYNRRFRTKRDEH